VTTQLRVPEAKSRRLCDATNQLERLTEFFLLNAGNAPKEVKEQLDIYHNTQRKIRAAWNDLSQHEQAFLWNQMSQYLTIQSATEEGVPEETTGQ